MKFWKELSKKEELSRNSICMWFEAGEYTGAPWDVVSGEWFWSEDLSTMYNCLREVVVRETIQCHYLFDEGKYNPERLNKYELEEIITLAKYSDEDKSNYKVFSEILEKLLEVPKNFEQLNNLIMDTVDLFKKLDIKMSVTLVKGFDNCISLLKAHDMYDQQKSGKEMLESDCLF